MAKKDKKTAPDMLEVSVGLLRELNQELDKRFGDLPADVQAILTQKGAVTQTLLREWQELLTQADADVAAHEALLVNCRKWRDEFMIPLKKQCEGETVENPLYVTHLDRIIEEVNESLDR